MIWFSADTHFCHANIIRYCKRPFENIDLHNETILNNWNSRVSDTDSVYFLGDFGFATQEKLLAIRKMLKGRIHYIRGNHDKSIRSELAESFEWVRDYYELKVPDGEMGVVQRIILFHYPIHSWNARSHGSWHCHGHSHGTVTSSDSLARLDVGVDAQNFSPISYEEVKIKMTAKVFKPFEGERNNETPR